MIFIVTSNQQGLAPDYPRVLPRYRSCGIIADNVTLLQEATAEGSGLESITVSLRHRFATPAPRRFLSPPGEGLG